MPRWRRVEVERGRSTWFSPRSGRKHKAPGPLPGVQRPTNIRARENGRKRLGVNGTGLITFSLALPPYLRRMLCFAVQVLFMIRGYASGRRHSRNRLGYARRKGAAVSANRAAKPRGRVPVSYTDLFQITIPDAVGIKCL
jgi:hypothetical protein